MQPDYLLGMFPHQRQVVRDQQNGQLPLHVNLRNEIQQGACRHCVHPLGRFIEHEHIGFGGQRAGNEHSLLLAA